MKISRSCHYTEWAENCVVDCRWLGSTLMISHAKLILNNMRCRNVYVDVFQKI